MLKLIRWLRGYRCLTLKPVPGRRMWNVAAQSGIFLWDLQQTPQSLTAKVSRKDYPLLMELLTEYAIFPQSSSEKGLFATFFRYRKRWGILAGTILAVGFLCLSQQFVWNVRIEGANPQLEQELLVLLDEMGVRPGAAKSAIDTYWIPVSLRVQCGDIAWAALNLYGVTAILRVLEYTPPPEMIDTGVPANVIAAADGQITSMSVTDGHALVSIGDVVQKNQVLVSGVWQDQWGMTHLSRASAEIKAKIPLIIDTSVDLSYPGAKLTGQVVTRRSLSLWGNTIPLYLTNTPEGLCKIETVTVPVTLFGLPLPAKVTTERLIFYEPVTLSRTQQQALTIAHRQLAYEENRLLSQGEIYQRELEAVTEESKLTLTARYLILSDIAVQQEIAILENDKSGEQRDISSKDDIQPSP